MWGVYVVSNNEIKRMLKEKKNEHPNKANGDYLVCDKCAGYYELQLGEKPEDFDNKCECGGKLIHSKSLENIKEQLNEPEPVITCGYCGTNNLNYANFCQECGKKIISETIDEPEVEKTNKIIDLDQRGLDRSVDRNLKGIELEKAGKINQAIKLYEMNIKDNFEGNHPYDRLAIIYRRNKKYDEEIRVLKKAIEVFEYVVTTGRLDGPPKLQRFQERLKKAQKLQSDNLTNKEIITKRSPETEQIQHKIGNDLESSDSDLETEIKTLMDGLKSSDPEVRRMAPIKLSTILNPKSQHHPYNLVRNIILKIGIDPIIETLENGDRSSKVSMAWCLGYLNDESVVKPLISSLYDEEVTGAIVINLVKLKKFSTTPLIDILSSEDDTLINAAAEALGEIGDERTVEPLINLLVSNPKVTYATSNALSKIKSKKSVEPIIKLLKNDDKNIKRQSATILGNIGDKRAIEPLIETLNDKDAYLRRRVVVALGQINDDSVIDPLLNSLNDSAASVRGDAARSIGNIGEEIHLKPLEKLITDKNDNVRKSALDAIKTIKNKTKEYFVPEWDGYYPSLESATSEQKEFYEKWLFELNNGNYLDIEGNLSYIFVFLYDVIENFLQDKDIENLVNSFEMISVGYNQYEKLGRYLTGWKSDAFLYLDDKEKALEILINENEFNFRSVLEYTILKADYNLSFINGKDIVNMMLNQGLTDFGRENKNEISNIVSSLLDKFHKQKGKPILKYFLEEFKLNNLTNNDFKNLENYFSNKKDFIYYKEIYEKEERNKKEIRYPGFALAEELEFYGFRGVPLSYRPDDPKFKKVIYQDYDDKKIYVPAIVVEAIKTEFKRILREAENKLRVGRDLPKIGEGWISETDLFYKIKESFPAEEIIHHGRPSWLGRQHLDVYFPEKNIGIEYQGIQHNEPIEHFGGEESFEKMKALDALKKEKCDKNGCNLIYVYPNYDFGELKEKINKLI